MKKLKFPQISTRCILATVLLLCAATSSPTRAADNSLRAAAIVNEDIITLYDLEQRIQLVMMSSNLPDNMETRSRMTQQILRHLIQHRPGLILDHKPVLRPAPLSERGNRQSQQHGRNQGRDGRRHQDLDDGKACVRTEQNRPV